MEQLPEKKLRRWQLTIDKIMIKLYLILWSYLKDSRPVSLSPRNSLELLVELL